MKFGAKKPEIVSQEDQFAETTIHDNSQFVRVNVPYEPEPIVGSLSAFSNKIQKEIQYLDKTIEAVRRAYDTRVNEIQEAAVIAVKQQTDSSNELIAELETMRKELQSLL